MEKLVCEIKYEDIGKYGEMNTHLSRCDFKKIGVEIEDTVKVSFLDKTMVVPFLPNYRCLCPGASGLVSFREDLPVDLMTYHGNFVKNNKIAIFAEIVEGETDILVCKGIKFPIVITFELDKKGGYHNDYLIYNLIRTNDRNDYKELGDEDYCNFRNVAIGRIKPGILYRSSTPINPSLKRNKYADDCLKKYGIKSIINLCDNEETAKKFEGFADTYYSKQKVIYLNSNADTTSYQFGKALIKGIRFMLANEGPYLIHCIEGQDRTGMTCAFYEALLGASRNQIFDDYMKTFENFYKIKRGTEQYSKLANGIVQKNIFSYRGFDFDTIDILKSPESYFLFLDLREEELKAFKDLLSGMK